jgi:hypothetical protein
MAYKLLPSHRAGSTAETPKLWENIFASISTALFSWGHWLDRMHIACVDGETRYNPLVSIA